MGGTQQPPSQPPGCACVPLRVPITGWGLPGLESSQEPSKGGSILPALQTRIAVLIKPKTRKETAKNRHIHRDGKCTSGRAAQAEGGRMGSDPSRVRVIKMS